jgi:L-rhamnose mutarotase
MKYLGTDLAADRKSVADDPETKRWWELVRRARPPLSPWDAT